MQKRGVMGSVAKGSFLAVSLLSLGLAGCGSSSTSTGGTDIKAITIFTDLPVSGTDAGEGLPTQYGVDLAVDQNKTLDKGYTLTVVHNNDEGATGPDGSVGAANIQKMVSNANVIAGVGPFNSGVAKSEISIINNAGLVMISPTNTNPGLTQQDRAVANGITNFTVLHPAGKPEAYFRIPGTDQFQGPAIADYAVSKLSAKTVYIVDDSSVYGKGIADTFVSEFQAKGGTSMGRTSITADQLSTLPSLATNIAAKNPDMVFFGGVTSQGGAALKQDLVKDGYTKPYGGGDGIADDPKFLSSAGADAANGAFGTVAAPDIEGSTSAAATKFKSDYTAFVAGKPDNDLLPYSAQSYDAAMIEIKAIKNVIAAGKPVNRDTVRAEVATIHYDGVIGTIFFDANGDNAGQKVFSVWDVEGGKWVVKGSVSVGS